MAIDNPRATEPVQAPRASDPGEAPRGKRVKNDDEVALENTNRMRDYFAAQKKVTVKTREDEWVQINGYTFVIKAGEKVEVPEDVALILEESGRI